MLFFKFFFTQKKQQKSMIKPKNKASPKRENDIFYPLLLSTKKETIFHASPLQTQNPAKK
jgi:hypothetical protein